MLQLMPSQETICWMDVDGEKFNTPSASELVETLSDQVVLPFAVYLVNDLVNSMEYVNTTLEQACR